MRLAYIFLWLGIGFLWLGSFIFYGFNHECYTAIPIASYISSGIMIVVSVVITSIKNS